jgi:hypothetical protein
MGMLKTSGGKVVQMQNRIFEAVPGINTQTRSAKVWVEIDPLLRSVIHRGFHLRIRSESTGCHDGQT